MKVDIAVIGGGLVGATLALALGVRGLRVTIIERSYTPTPSTALGLRVSTFTVASERILRALGVWSALPPDQVGPMREMHVWEHRGEIHFDSAEIGEPVLGHIVAHTIVQQAIEECIGALPNIVWQRGITPTELISRGDNVEVVLAGQSLQAALVVGADGADSQVRALAGIEVDADTYHQEAIVAEVRTALPHRQTARQRFLPNGPLAFLPLSNGASSIVWATTPAHAQRLCALDDTTFGDEVASAFDGKLGAVHPVSARAAFPLRHLHARTYIRDRVALVGDAAHIVHPLAGQGVNLGLLDAAALASVIGDAHQRGRNIGARATLRRYERWRRGHNALMQAVLSGFQRLFSNRCPPVRRLRETGLTLTDRCSPLKASFMRFASGLDGDLPALARGVPSPEAS